MQKIVLGTCPVCAHQLKVSRLHCTHCNTSIEGEFELDKFSYLSKEDKHFIEIFIKNRGNIKEIEKDLGISYPTVRRNLDRVINALGYGEASEMQPNKQDILEALSAGKITSEEALKQLKEISDE